MFYLPFLYFKFVQVTEELPRIQVNIINIVGLITTAVNCFSCQLPWACQRSNTKLELTFCVCMILNELLVSHDYLLLGAIDSANRKCACSSVMQSCCFSDQNHKWIIIFTSTFLQFRDFVMPKCFSQTHSKCKWASVWNIHPDVKRISTVQFLNCYYLLLYYNKW